jgi:hypothetical protein
MHATDRVQADEGSSPFGRTAISFPKRCQKSTWTISKGEKKVSGLFPETSPGDKRCQDSFFGLPRGRMVDCRFNCCEMRWTHVSPPNGEPRLTLMRTALSSTAVSGVLARSTPRGARERGQTESRCGSRSGASSHRFSEPHLQSSARLTRPARKESCHSGFRAFHSTHSLLKTTQGARRPASDPSPPWGRRIRRADEGETVPRHTALIPFPDKAPDLSQAPRPCALTPTLSHSHPGSAYRLSFRGRGRTRGGAANCISQPG